MKRKPINYNQMNYLVKLGGLKACTKLDLDKKVKLNLLIADLLEKEDDYNALRLRTFITDGGVQVEEQGKKSWRFPEEPERSKEDKDQEYEKKLAEYLDRRSKLNKALISLGKKPCGISVEPFLDKKEFSMLESEAGISILQVMEVLCYE